MRITAVVLVVIAHVAVCPPTYALYRISDEGRWPKTWPAELEPLRMQSRTITGSLLNPTTYEIPFSRRDAFEAAWPQLLKVKTAGAPIVLRSSPQKQFGKSVSAGVMIRCPPRERRDEGAPGRPIAGATDRRERWLWTTYIELIVDGDVVDLNRISLPPETPVIDERFQAGSSP